MELNFINLPVANLPYEDIRLCKQMMLRLYEKIPFLPELPLMDPNDNIYHRTLMNMPCLKYKDQKLLLPDSNDEDLSYIVMQYEKIYNSNAPYDIDMFKSEAPFFYMYIEILKKLKPKYTVINLLGPFTLCNSIFNKNASTILLDKTYRSFIICTITIKALWFIQKIKEASPSTTPIILFDEKLLYKFGTIKRTNESITKETVTSLLSRIFFKLHKEGAKIAIQSFEKCNWQLIFDTDYVDMISFDAYSNPSNISILADSVNRFMAKGGYLNFGIVPAMNENAIRSLNINDIYNRLASTFENFHTEGVSIDLINRRSTISIQNDLSKYPIIFAEKAIMISHQLSKKLPINPIH